MSMRRSLSSVAVEHSDGEGGYRDVNKRRRMNTANWLAVGSHSNPISLDSDDEEYFDANPAPSARDQLHRSRSPKLIQAGIPGTARDSPPAVSLFDSSEEGQTAVPGPARDDHSPVPRLDPSEDAFPEDDVPEENLRNLWSDEVVLDAVQTIFPDICPTFLRDQYTTRLYEFGGGEPLMAGIVNHISELADYPRKAKVERVKPATAIRWGHPPWDLIAPTQQPMPMPPLYFQAAKMLLIQELPHLNQHTILAKLASERSLYKAYDVLTDSEREAENAKGRLKTPRKAPASTTLHASAREFALGSDAYHDKTVLEELKAAQDFSRQREVARESQFRAAAREAENEALAVASGEIQECGCCFADTPLNRMAHCGTETTVPHSFCYECTKKNAETTIGSGGFAAQCMDMSGCKAAFELDQLQICLRPKTIDVMLKRQQLDEVKKAIPDLVDCPFCDFVASCAPIESNREFTCGTPACGVVSCRQCREPTHIPLSCQEAAVKRASEKNLDHRHTVEEAMSEALLRTCNKCQTKFVKDGGCNKMRCTKCGNTQCYICGANTVNYEHFSRGKCVIHDDYDEAIRHDEEVKKAEAAAKAKIRAQHMDISEEDLTVKVSAVVQSEEDSRLLRAKNHGTRGNPADPYAHIRNPPARIPPVPVPAARNIAERQERLGQLRLYNAQMRAALGMEVNRRQREPPAAPAAQALPAGMDQLLARAQDVMNRALVHRPLPLNDVYLRAADLHQRLRGRHALPPAHYLDELLALEQRVPPNQPAAARGAPAPLVRGRVAHYGARARAAQAAPAVPAAPPMPPTARVPGAFPDPYAWPGAAWRPEARNPYIGMPDAVAPWAMPALPAHQPAQQQPPGLQPPGAGRGYGLENLFGDPMDWDGYGIGFGGLGEQGRVK